MTLSLTSYQRTARRILDKETIKPRPKPYWDGKRLYLGQKSLHLTSTSRMWRTFWRMKKSRV